MHHVAPLGAITALSLHACAVVDANFADPEPTNPSTNNQQPSTRDLSDFQTIENQETHPGGDALACIQATCPFGSVLLGGGGDFGNIRVTESAPFENTASWRVCGYSEDPSPWKAQAICASANVNLARATDSRALNVGEQACAEAVCPQGMQALSGGYISTSSVAGANRTGGISERWVACAEGEEPGATIEARAICAATATIFRDFGPGERFATMERPEECIQIQCPPSSQIIAGSQAWVHGIVLTQSMAITEDTWEICGIAPIGGDGKWTLEAVCLPSP